MNLTKKSEMNLFRRALAVLLTTLLMMNPISPIFTPKEVNAQENADAKFLSGVDMSSASVTTSWSDADKYSTDFYNEINNKYNSGYGSNSNALEIDTAGKLAAFAKAVNEGKDFSGKYVKLTKNIDLQGTDLTVKKTDDGTDSNGNAKFKVTISGAADNVWVPIGTSDNPFKGNFDGGNCEVKNMTVLIKQDSGNVYAGLFGYIESCTIQNTGVSGSVYAYSSYFISAGGLVGYNDGNVSNSYATGSVYSSSAGTAYSFTGGLVGENFDSSTISNSYATSSVYISSYCAYGGGLAGNNEGSINNSYATGSVYSSSAGSYGNSYTGGLAGFNMDSINNSYATGAIYSSASEEDCAGGLVGDTSRSSSISNSYATGSVYACASYSVYAGGLVGQNYKNICISNSYATGSVYASSASSNSNVCAGGLVGYNDENSSISNSYATGSVYASSSSSYVYAGGLVGYNYNDNDNDNVTNSYYNSEATIEGATLTDLGMGLTREQMTGIGISRSTNYMSDLAKDSWIFTEDKGAIRYFPRLQAITYGESNPAPYYEVGRLIPTADDFDFTPPDNLTYDGTPKEATVTAKDGITGMGEITINYYDISGPKLDSAPTDAGAYKVKINVDEGTNYEGSKAEIEDVDWTFIIEKATPSLPTGLTGIYGQTLSEIGFPPYENNIGTWYWNFPNTLIKVGAQAYLAHFISTSDNYKGIANAELTIDVSKATPTADDFDFTPPSNLTYDGTAKVATVTSDKAGMGDITIKYYNALEMELDSAPTDAGIYKVKINVTEGTNYEGSKAEIEDVDWTFTIGKADPTINSTATSVTYAPGLTLGNVSLPSTEGNTSGSWAWENPNENVGDAGEHGFNAIYTPTDTKNYNIVTKSITVTVGKATPTADDFDFTEPSNLTYDGTAKVATVTSDKEGIGTITINYYNSLGTKLNSAPTDAGTYKVKINVTEGTNYEESKAEIEDVDWTFTIGKATPTASDFDFTEPSNLTYDGTEKVATVTSDKAGMGTITIKYYNALEMELESAPTDAGTYKVKIDVADGDNYKSNQEITANSWTFTVGKADPTINSTATNVTYEPGLTLENVPFPSTEGNTSGSWAWENPNEDVGDAGEHEFNAIYTPNDKRY